MNKRWVWADILRILAIYLVILVHSSVLPRTPFVSALSAIILFSIATTCVPLFFMLSGALLLPKNEAMSFFLKKRFFRIVIPYIFWACIFILLLLLYKFPHSSLEMFQTLATGFRGFWFLPILYVLYLCTPSLRTYVKHSKAVQLLLPLGIWFLLVSLLPYIRNTAAFPLQSRDDILSQVVDFSGYFLLGYFVTISNYVKTKRISIILICIGLLWSTIETVYLYNKEGSINFLYYSYISPSNVILSIGIFSLFLNLDKTFRKLSTKTKNIISAISNLVFGVYLLQTVAVQIFDRIHITIPHTSLPVIVDLPLVALLCFICALSIIFLLSKIPYLKKIIS